MAHRDAQDARIADILGDMLGNTEYYQLIDDYAVWFVNNR
jgi:hypothetical protein